MKRIVDALRWANDRRGNTLADVLFGVMIFLSAGIVLAVFSLYLTVVVDTFIHHGWLAGLMWMLAPLAATIGAIVYLHSKEEDDL